MRASGLKTPNATDGESRLIPTQLRKSRALQPKICARKIMPEKILHGQKIFDMSIFIYVLTIFNFYSIIVSFCYLFELQAVEPSIFPPANRARNICHKDKISLICRFLSTPSANSQLQPLYPIVKLCPSSELQAAEPSTFPLGTRHVAPF